MCCPIPTTRRCPLNSYPPPRMPQAKVIRRAVRLTQEEFATRYHIPLGTLRD
jgi:DNA-binding transcriptional regulator YiaG